MPIDIGAIFIKLFLAPIVNLLAVIFQVFESLHIPGALGFSIIILTILIRLLVWPFMASQLKSAQKMAELKPKINALKEKHGKDKQAFAQAQMALYKEHGVNPAGGCLPAIIQIPIIWALFTAIQKFFEPKSLDWINNSILYIKEWRFTSPPDPYFFGLNLSKSPQDFGISLFILVPIITAALQLVQSRMMAPPQPLKEYSGDSPKEKKEKENMEDSMAAMQSQMLYMMPLMVGWFAYSYFIGIALYWNTFTILGIIQQYMISGWGGLENWIKFLKK